MLAALWQVTFCPFPCPALFGVVSSHDNQIGNPALIVGTGTFAAQIASEVKRCWKKRPGALVLEDFVLDFWTLSGLLRKAIAALPPQVQFVLGGSIFWEGSAAYMQNSCVVLTDLGQVVCEAGHGS